MGVPRGSLFAMLLCLSFGAHALEVVTEDDPPHNMMRDRKIVGTSTEKLEEAFKRGHVAAHIAMMPWARAYQSALQTSDVCVYSTARTAEREALFHWVGPLSSEEWVLYTRADNPVAITQLEDVRKEIIGGYAQDVISVWLADRGYRVDTVPNDEANPQKLLNNRFNYWASAKPRAIAVLDKQGLTKSIVPALTFGHTDLYLACNRAVSGDVVKTLNDALRHMKEDGTFAAIDARYAK